MRERLAFWLFDRGSSGFALRNPTRWSLFVSSLFTTFSVFLGSDRIVQLGLCNLASFCVMKGRIDKAEQIFESVLESNPLHPSALINLAEIHMTRHRFVIAHEYADKVSQCHDAGLYFSESQLENIKKKALWLSVRAKDKVRDILLEEA